MVLVPKYGSHAIMVSMAQITLGGNPVHTLSGLPPLGAKAPAAELVGADLNLIKLSDYLGRRVIINVFPSIDTGVCALSVRNFNQYAASLENTTVLCVSNDLPFALGRFCGAEGINNVVVGSAFRSDFGKIYGMVMVSGPLAGLLARSVIVLDEQGLIKYEELVPELKQEPNYDAAIAALG